MRNGANTRTSIGEGGLLRVAHGDDGYLRSSEPLSLIAPFVAAYHAALPLRKGELELLFDLVRARLATTISILYWRLAERAADDAYREKSLKTEGTAIQFLDALGALGRHEFVSSIKRKIGTD